MKVYKYRPNLLLQNEKRDIKSLVNNELYASRIADLNDPFEGSVNLPGSFADESWTGHIKRNLHDVGIYSLTQLVHNESFPSNELLWAHYANSHKGFCIEYDLDILREYISKCYDIRNLIHVNYSSERPAINWEMTDLNIFDVQKMIFGTKSLAWKYENEVRLVFETSGLKPLPDHAVTAIYFGLRMSLEDRQEIVQKMKSKHIDLYQMERVDNLYQLKASKLDFEFKYE